MVAPNQEQVEYDIRIEAMQAVKILSELTSKITSFDAKVRTVSATIEAMSKKWGMSFNSAKGLFKDLDKELSDAGQSTAMFGQLNRQGWNDVADSANKGSKRVLQSVNLIRIALGAIVSMILFNVIQAFTMLFSDAIKQAREFEATLYRIANVEKQLSESGIEVSTKQLKDGIKDIKDALPIFSKEDIAQMVGSLATTTKELGFTGEEILKLGAAIAILNINSTESETLLQTQAKVSNSLVSPQAKSIGNLGLAFGKAKMEAKGLSLGFLEAGESIDDLTEKEKSYIKYAIVLETANIDNIGSLEELRDTIKEAGGDYAALDAYLQSNDAKLASNAAAWSDLKVTIGQTIIPLIPVLTGFFKALNDSFSVAKVAIVEFLTFIGTAGIVLYEFFTGGITNADQFSNIVKTSMNTLRESMVNAFFKEMPDNAPEWFKRGWGKYIKEDAETATAGIDGLGEAVDNFDADGFGNKIEDIIEDAKQAREDLDIKFEQKTRDIDTEYIRKAADAEVDLARKIEDINIDATRAIEDAKRKAREQEIKDEQEHQNRLWELRMRYLMDLEEALHARDARQVLRLMKQYAIDRESLERSRDLEEEARSNNLQAELEDIERKRQQKIEDARIEHEQTLADQQEAKQREIDDLNLWRDRELADIEQGIQRKLEALIKGWIDEKKITEQNAAEVYAILAKYFGPGGMTDALYQYMAASLAQAGQAALSSYSQGLGGGYIPGSPLSGGVDGGNNGGGGGGGGLRYAEGGTLLATRPTKAMFGEDGPEAVTFTPLNRIGKNQNKVFGGEGAGMNGTIEVLVDLSPDLEARIVNNSMEGVANVISRVNRSKV